MLQQRIQCVDIQPVLRVGGQLDGLQAEVGQQVIYPLSLLAPELVGPLGLVVEVGARDPDLGILVEQVEPEATNTGQVLGLESRRVVGAFFWVKGFGVADRDLVGSAAKDASELFVNGHRLPTFVPETGGLQDAAP